MPSHELKRPVEHVADRYGASFRSVPGNACARLLQHLLGLLQRFTRLLNDRLRGPHLLVGRSGACGTGTVSLPIRCMSPGHRWLLPLEFPHCCHSATCRT